MIKRKVVFVVFALLLLSSLAFASAFSLGDWLRGLFGSKERVSINTQAITGRPVGDDYLLAKYTFDSVFGYNNVVQVSEGIE